MATKKDEQTSISTQTAAFLSTELIKNPAISIEKPFSREIFLMHTKIAGLRYVKNIKRLAKSLKTGDSVKLVREPQNEFDERAILIKNSKGKKLGYIPRNRNEVVSRLMDAGKLIIAKVCEVDFREDEEVEFWALNIYVDVYMVD